MKRFVNATFVLLILFVLGLMASCQKDPQPEPTPETPVTPVKTHDTIYWNWDKETTFGPRHDSIKKHLTPELEQLAIQIHGNDGIHRPVDCTNTWSIGWTLAREELGQCMVLDSLGRIVIRGTFIVNDANATDPYAYEPGLTPDNRNWFEGQGCTFLFPRAITNGGKTR